MSYFLPAALKLLYGNSFCPFHLDTVMCGDEPPNEEGLDVSMGCLIENRVRS